MAYNIFLDIKDFKTYLENYKTEDNPENTIYIKETMQDIKNTLAERGSRYGEFHNHSFITQALKQQSSDFLLGMDKQLSPAHQEALDMIFHKIGRILNGDPNYKDSWHDIAGYAKLAEDACVE